MDNGWYASGLTVVREALPPGRDRLQHQPAIPGNQPAGQMYGGYYVDQDPAGYHNGALDSDPRIAIYMGMGLHQMPGNVWWCSWRVLPPQRCPTDPDFSWQGQWPPEGYWVSWRRSTTPSTTTRCSATSPATPCPGPRRTYLSMERLSIH